MRALDSRRRAVGFVVELEAVLLLGGKCLPAAAGICFQICLCCTLDVMGCVDIYLAALGVLSHHKPNLAAVVSASHMLWMGWG